MTIAVAAGCGVVGLVVGWLLLPVVDRVPEKVSLAGAYPPPAPADTRHWIVVVVTGAVYAALGAHFGASWALPPFLVLAASLVAVSAIDLAHYIVPNRIVYPTLAVAIPLLVGAALLVHHPAAIRTAAIGSVSAWLGLFILHVIQPKGMGFGDVRLAAILGLYLGWINLRLVLWGILIGFVISAVLGVGLIVFAGRNRKDALPFAPFLAAGTVLAVLFSRSLLG